MIKHIVSLPYKIITYLKYRVTVNGFFFRSKLILDKDNSFESTSEVYSSSIYCKGGGGNIIKIHNKLMHSDIKIEGNNNLLSFEEGGSIAIVIF